MPDYKRAVLIGNSNFALLPPLRCPRADVEAMHQVLTNEQICWFNPVHTLIDAPHNEIFTRINEVMRDADKEDLVLVYYSGHGLLDRAGRLYLAGNNSNPSLLHSTAVPVANIRDCLSESRCQRFVLFLDCCYGGAAAVSFRNGRSGISTDFGSGDEVDGIGEFVMSASTAIHRAKERPEDSLGLFTKHVVEGLSGSGADRDGDGMIRLEELFSYVEEKLAGESEQKPLRWVSGSSASFIIARTPRARNNELQNKIRERLQDKDAISQLPATILAALREMTEMDIDAFRSRHTATGWLAYGWARGDIATDELIDQWYRLRSDLICVDQPADVPVEKRWRIVNSARTAVLDLVGPTYLLDANYHFLDWNPAFDEIVAKPLRLLRGTHAENFVIALTNSRDVIARAQQMFQEDADIPLVDCEVLELETERHGLIRFRKIATQIAETPEHGLVWSVTLNIEHAEHADVLWEDINRRLSVEANWSRYAESYDRMLLNFTGYDVLLGQVSSLLGNARRCADLGAGTGNGTLRLLDSPHPDRVVAAFESNEVMLQHFRTKLRRHPASNRVTLYKGDITLSLKEFPENSFDGALMVNVLYALDDPCRCLDEIFRVLQPGACLAISTSHAETDVNGLFDAIRADLRKKELLNDLRNSVENAYERNVQMLRNIRRDTRDDVIGYLSKAGFEITHRIDRAYANAVMIVQARKPAPTAKSITSLDEPPSTPLQSRDQIFISYSHDDRDWLVRLQKFLAPAVRAGRLKSWDDRNLKVGDQWRAEIQAAIERAKIVILLVSQNFLASEFIANEEFPQILKAAQQNGLKIVWLMLSAATVKLSPLAPIIASVQSAHSPDLPLDQMDEPDQNKVLSDFVIQLAESLG